jgi:hypothetical protein
MAKYNIKFVFEPTLQGLTVLDYESWADSKEDLIKEIIYNLTIQTFEVVNGKSVLYCSQTDGRVN